MSETWLWIVFNAIAIAALAVDLGVFHRKAHEIRPREAAVWACVWVGIALLVNLGILRILGRQKALEFLTGYIIEESLSVDNIFVFVLIFAYFRVPPAYQHRVLFWGILGAILLRGSFILSGIALLRYFGWILYLLGLLLIWGGVQMLRNEKVGVDPSRNRVLKLFRRFVPILNEYDGARMMTRRDGHWLATPLLVVLIVLETTDLVFAFDSIPAVLGITRDPFIVYSSNISAILGLRTLYFLFASVVDRLRFLHIGLAVVLMFIGVKMLIGHWIEVPTALSLAFVAVSLGVAVAASLGIPEPRNQT